MFGKSKFSGGFLIGFGAGFVARDLLLDQASICRPFAKSALKTGYVLFEKTRESIAFALETVEDLFAEVRDETKKSSVKTAQSAKKGANFGPEKREEVLRPTDKAAQKA